MAKTFQLDIVTPEKTVFSQAVEFVALPAYEGEMGVLAGHMPLIAELKAGELRYESAGKTEVLAVSGGFAQVSPDKVVVLADTAEMAEEIDLHRAQMKLEARRVEMKGSSIDPNQMAVIQAALQKEMIRLKVGERRKKLIP